MNLWIVPKNSFYDKMFCLKTSIYEVTEIYCTARQGTHDNKRRGMRFACWLHKARNKHSDYVVFILFPYQKLLRHHTTLLRDYVYFLSCFTFVIADFPLQTHNAFYIMFSSNRINIRNNVQHKSQ